MSPLEGGNCSTGSSLLTRAGLPMSRLFPAAAIVTPRTAKRLISRAV